MSEYEERLRALFDAMRQQGFGPAFKGDAAKAKSVLQRNLDTMSRYIDRVYDQESLASELELRPTDQALRAQMEAADDVRTSAHNAAMASLRTVNRVFELYGLEPFIAVEPDEHRSSVGEKIAAYVSMVFLDVDQPLSRTDAAVRAHELGLGHGVRSQRLSELLDRLADA